MIITIGTGLGTCIFTDGALLPNTELGHIEIDGMDAELNASDAARKRQNMSWKEWGKKFNTYLMTLEKYLWPDLIILGGGGSKKFHKFEKQLTLNAEIIQPIPGSFLH